MKFKKEFLINECDLPWAALEDKIIDNSRWSIHHEIIFEYEGKFYKTYYSVGATESQDERPWEYEDEVDCTEVVQQEIKVMAWVPVKEAE
ncbi:MAG TPA: hypothetical protein DDZ66_02285 [Firmicutes bacterium]|nr:hypothetical protein [Bacillota bacterium]